MQDGWSPDNWSNETGSTVSVVMESQDQCTDAYRDRICQVVLLIQGSKKASRESLEADLTLYNDMGWLWACFAFLAPLALFGIIGNIVTVVMFAKFIKRTTTSIFIIALAIVDLTMCGVSLPIFIYRLFRANIPSDFVCKLQWFLNFLAVPMSACILIVIALDRFFLIFLVKTNVMTKLRAKVVLVVLTVLCVALAIPILLTYSTYTHVSENVASECPGGIKCDVKKCTEQDFIPIHVRKSILLGHDIFFIITVLVFLVLYALIFAKVYSMHKRLSRWKTPDGSYMSKDPDEKTEVDDDHLTFASNGATEPPTSPQKPPLDGGVGTPAHKPSGEKPAENENLVIRASMARPTAPPKKKKKRLPHLHTAITLAVVTLTFVVAYAPIVLVTLLRLDTPTRNSAQYFFWNFFYINHVTNPIIYAFMNPRFKEALRNLCRRRRRGS